MKYGINVFSFMVFLFCLHKLVFYLMFSCRKVIFKDCICPNPISYLEVASDLVGSTLYVAWPILELYLLVALDSDERDTERN